MTKDATASPNTTAKPRNTRPATPAPDWKSAIATGFDHLESLFKVAQNADELINDAMSWDLINLAGSRLDGIRQIADRATGPADTIDGGAILRELIVVEALVQGAQSAGPVVTGARRALQAAMLKVIDRFTDALAGNPGNIAVALVAAAASLHEVSVSAAPLSCPDGDVHAITEATPIYEGGYAAQMLMLRCTHEIDTMANCMIERARDMDDEDENYLIHTLARRVRDINSLLMSFHSDDGVTMQEAAQVIYQDPRIVPATYLRQEEVAA